MNQLQTFWALIQRDWAVFVPEYKDRFINTLFWITLVIIVFEYIMPEAGLKNYGVFIAVSSIAVCGLWNVMNIACDMIADLENERSITYYLTLPLPQWMVFVRIAISNAIQATALCVFFLPLAKVLLWNQFSFAQINWFQFTILFILTNLFYGFFSLFLASCIKSFKTVENVQMRIMWPMWFAGCYQFTWTSLYQLSPALAYASCVNPLVFIHEGIRVATFGQEGSLPFVVCMGALVIFIVLFGVIGIWRLKKRLDCL